MALGAQAGAGPGGRAETGPRPLLVADPEAKPATEFLDLLQDLARVLQPRVANPPGPDRKAADAHHGPAPRRRCPGVVLTGRTTTLTAAWCPTPPWRAARCA